MEKADFYSFFNSFFLIILIHLQTATSEYGKADFSIIFQSFFNSFFLLFLYTFRPRPVAMEKPIFQSFFNSLLLKSLLYTSRLRPVAMENPIFWSFFIHFFYHSYTPPDRDRWRWKSRFQLFFVQSFKSFLYISWPWLVAMEKPIF